MYIQDKMKKMFIIVVVCLLIFTSITFGLDNETCPMDCHCHYSRINWVTDCSESNLTTIPYDELSLNVYTLDMTGNNVRQITQFPEDIKLRQLEMAHNRLNALKRESFVGLMYLIQADFSYNFIRKVDPDTFRDIPGLLTLDLQNNPIDVVEGAFLNSRTLQQLDLNSCGIDKLNPLFFQNTTNLNKLDLSNNPLLEIEPGPFDHLISLEYLKLNACNLSKVSSGALGNLENLRVLEMSENNMKTVNWTSFLAPLIRLEYLDIRKTGITNLPGDAFAKNFYLRNLILADNELWHLDIGNTLGHNLHNLQSLDLSNCNLQDRLSEEAFRNASKLRVLNLSGNPMFATDLTVVLRHLPKLHKLSLSNCSLKRLPNAFESFENLEELDISYNPLSDAFVSLLNPLKSLEYLDMSYCELGYVGNNTFAQMTSLKTLILSGNRLHTLENGLFANLTKLENLALNDCQLKTPLDSKVFGDRGYTNLIKFELRGNPLTLPDQGSLLPKQLSNVEILDLSNCHLNNLNENLFSETRNLTKLNLSSNAISSLHDLVFLKQLMNLETLDLSINNLITIHPKVFENNPNLVSVNLLGNQFMCNCSIVDMWNWAFGKNNDSQILVGSQPLNPEAKAVKLRKSLTCSYDPDTYRGLLEQSRAGSSNKPFLRKGDLTPTRTWAKYYRESNCDKSAL